MCCGRAKLRYSGITLASVLWKSEVALLRDHFGQCAVEELRYVALLWDHFGQCAVEERSFATQGSLWPVCCGRAKLRYSGITLASVLWKSSVALLRDHFGQCAVEELSCATQGSLWPVCCGRATLRCATQGSLWPVCCGRTKLRYSGITLANVLWKS